MPASIAVRMMRMLSASRRSGLPRWKPPRPIADTRCPVRPSVRMGMLPPIQSAGAIGVAVLGGERSEEHTSELQSQSNLVCRLLLEKKRRTQHFSHQRRLLQTRRYAFSPDEG